MTTPSACVTGAAGAAPAGQVLRWPGTVPVGAASRAVTAAVPGSVPTRQPAELPREPRAGRGVGDVVERQGLLRRGRLAGRRGDGRLGGRHDRRPGPDRRRRAPGEQRGAEHQRGPRTGIAPAPSRPVVQQRHRSRVPESARLRGGRAVPTRATRVHERRSRVPERRTRVHERATRVPERRTRARCARVLRLCTRVLRLRTRLLRLRARAGRPAPGTSCLRIASFSEYGCTMHLVAERDASGGRARRRRRRPRPGLPARPPAPGRQRAPRPRTGPAPRRG